MNTTTPGEAGHKHVSLCLIVGNVAEYIERCLTSFAPIADEIILVRAIGKQEPDDTFIIAEAVCQHFSIPLITDQYLNAPGHRTWPHVDSFAAARQMSFDLASGTYCFWADSDDILKSGADLIRQYAIAAAHPVYIFPYEIFGRGVTVPRERMIRRDCGGKWQYPVHECYTFPATVDGGTDERVIIQHLPHTTKTGSMDRNLRILESIPDAELTPGLLYHLHCEQRGAGRTVDAIKSAQRALEHPGLGRPEKYELFLNLAALCEKRETAHAYLMQAYGTDPNRREALGLLACTAIDSGRPADALSFARQMIATPRPHDWSWNDRGAAYGWIGNDIYQQALRANGQLDDAEKVRLHCLAQARGPRISLLHATRGRARKASAARKIWIDLAENPDAIEHIFAIDADDDASFALRRFHHIEVPAGGGCVAAWNAAAAISTGDILIQLSDDWMPPAKWDTEIIKRFGDLRIPKVMQVSDGFRTDGLLCIAILTRARYLDQRHLFHPDFKSVFSDTWFTHTARRDRILVDATDLVFEHQHPLAGKGEWDQTYAESNSDQRYAEGRAIYDRLLHTVECWQDIDGWFDYPDLYRWIAESCKDGDIIVEVGCWKGRSVNYLASACRALGKKPRIIAVDTFCGEAGQIEHAHCGYFRDEFERNLKACGNDDIIEICESDSAAAAAGFKDGEVFAVFIDAAHEYEPVLRDLKAWIPKVRPEGILAGHDYHHEPVRRAVDELLPLACRASISSWIDASRRDDYSAELPIPSRASAPAKTGPVLSILIPGIPERMANAKLLIAEIADQAGSRSADVEVLYCVDNRQRTVGAKRQALQDIARGQYIAFCDDDDKITPAYVAALLEAAASGVDVITFHQRAFHNDQECEIVFDAMHRTDDWKPNGVARRRPWHVCAWRRELIQHCRFGDCNYGEDRIWVDQAVPLIRTSHHIHLVLHEYRHNAATTAAPPPQ